ncbi:hypothetical protein OIU34_26585 [Pararhizobium sp. BT-229]|uniref:hypothetical protein n=1 Tax=Pararhizobium sp. BT-229 TaxID=2986923 RepID=UPI0021F70291|nr:hypothetical protein [Pararhizobium sp. BT-229]MCV9965450.1 hypothetical protein [Pararhizobium sp. BT-229]
MSFFTAEEIAKFEGVVRCSILGQLHFATKTMGVWNGMTELDVGGVTYMPAFGAAQIEGLSFTGGVTAEQVTLSIPAVNETMLGMALAETEEVDQRLMKLLLQTFDEDWQPIAAAPVIFFGYMQPPRVSRTEVRQTDIQGPTQSASIECLNAFFNAGLPAGGRNTDRDQQVRSPGDKIFQFTAGLRNKTISYPDV